jgi:archaellum biogenesis protein FlaJ (TadC family)
MSFEEFQNRSRLYVIGALESQELDEFENARKQFGQKAEDFIGECYALHEAFALSLKPAKSSAALKDRLMSMVRERQKN